MSAACLKYPLLVSVASVSLAIFLMSSYGWYTAVKRRRSDASDGAKVAPFGKAGYQHHLYWECLPRSFCEIHYRKRATLGEKK